MYYLPIQSSLYAPPLPSLFSLSEDIDDHAQRIIRRGHLSYASPKWVCSENGTFRGLYVPYFNHSSDASTNPCSPQGPFHCAGKRWSVTTPALFMRPLFFMPRCSVAGVGPSSSPRRLPRLSANLRRLLVISKSTVLSKPTVQTEHFTAALLTLYVEFIPVRV
jgi:hypothetical protein